jgi:hypothetical protein
MLLGQEPNTRQRLLKVLLSIGDFFVMPDVSHLTQPSLSCLYSKGTQGNNIDSVNSVKNTVPEKPGWGGLPRPRLFSFHSGQSVREWGTTLEAMGKENILLLTVTVPCDSVPAKIAIVSQSSYINNRLNVAISERLGCVEKKFYFYVKEFTQRGGLHWHYAVCVPKDMQPLFSTAWLQKIVHRILECASKRSEFDLLTAQDSADERYQPENLIVRVEPLRYTVVGYFSKIEKKHGKVRTEAKSPYTLPDGTVLCPTLWARASQDLSKETNKYRVKIKFYADTKTEAKSAVNELKALIGVTWTPLNHENYNYNSITGYRSWVLPKRFAQVISIFQDVADKYCALAKSRHAKSNVYLGQSVTCRLFPNGIVRLQMTHEQAKLDEDLSGAPASPPSQLVNKRPTQTRAA